jgi:hypothetical protein
MISFFDQENNEIFQASRAFAIDNQEVYTEKVTTNLRQEGDDWFIDISLDQQWLQDPSRQFPVTIDPTVNFQPNDSDVHDTFVADGDPDKVFYNYPWLAAGKNSYGVNLSYIWFNLPSLYSGAMIESASLELNQYVEADDPNTTIDLHEVLEPWTQTNITWNNRPAHNSTVLHDITGDHIGLWEFDATSAVQQWYSGKQTNYGLMLKARDENMDRRGFRSSENGDATVNPKLVINYKVDPTGIESFWSYVNNVNVHNGNLFLSDVDVSLPGKGVPIHVIRSYNSRSTTNTNTFGYGWQLNVGMSLNYQDPYNSKVVVFTDGDGTEHIFTEKKGQDGMWEAPPGVELDLVYQAATSTDPTDYYILNNQSKTKYYFDFNTGVIPAKLLTPAN